MSKFHYTKLWQENRKEAEDEFFHLQARLREEHGSRLSGTLAEANGIIFNGQKFESQREAEQWLMKATSRWGPAIAVKISGQKGWFVGGRCSS